MGKAIEFIGIDDYINAKRSINLDAFSNIEKGITSADFKNKYPSSKYIVLEKAGLDRLAVDIESKANALEKGGKKRNNTLKKGAELIGSFEKVTIRENNESSHFWVIEKPEKEIQKALNNDLKKGELSDALSYGSLSKGTFKKTGKEIKENVSGLMKEIKVKIGTYEAEQQALVKTIGSQPTEKLDRWDLSKVGGKSTLRKYPYEMMYGNENKVGEGSLFPTVVGVGQDPKEAAKTLQQAVRDHNRSVSMTIDCVKDLICAEVFVRNLDKKKTYELSFNELKSLNF